MMTYQHYNKHEFLKQFYYSDWFTQLRKDYTYLFSDKIDICVPYAGNHNTVRHQIDTSSIFLFSVCYYLGFLIEKNPQVIADVGCGENIFKKYLPNIIGFDQSSAADVQEWFDDEFVSKHTDEFECAFAINSLHYISFYSLDTISYSLVSSILYIIWVIFLLITLTIFSYLFSEDKYLII